MPGGIKKQSLLGAQDAKKRKPKKAPSRAQQAQASAQAQAQANAKAAAAAAKAKTQKKAGGIGKKIKNTFLLLIVVAIIIVPKPQLLVYKKLGLVASSIYIPGWFGSPGKLLDSPQRVVLEKQLGLVYLCFGDIDPDKQLQEQCNRYQFVEQKGMFAAFSHYRENPTGQPLE